MRSYKANARILVGWRVVYESGGRYQSDLHRWDDLPIYGIQGLFKYWINDPDLDGRVYLQVQVDQDSYFPYYVKSFKDAEAAIPRVKMGSQISGDEFGKLIFQEEEFARDNPIVKMIDNPYIW